MRVFAYCAATFELSVRRAAGVRPELSPPAVAAGFDPARLAGYDLLYFGLHGLPDQPYWYGDGWLTALGEEQIRGADLGGAVVFAANCYTVESPMLAALLAAGASCVVAGAGQNWARPVTPYGAHALGHHFRRLLSWRLSPTLALRLARARLALANDDAATLDALQFRVYRKDDVTDD